MGIQPEHGEVLAAQISLEAQTPCAFTPPWLGSFCISQLGLGQINEIQIYPGAGSSPGVIAAPFSLSKLPLNPSQMEISVNTHGQGIFLGRVFAQLHNVFLSLVPMFPKSEQGVGSNDGVHSSFLPK